jgi:amino acid adenylation domain-containing protein
MQSGMLFHALKNKHSRAYFEQMTFRLKGNINSDLLQQSFDIIFARYDILRTVFRVEKLEEPMQFVLKQRNFKLYFEDISHLSETGKNTYVEEFAEKDREKGFDLIRDILMRASLFKMGADVYTLTWSFHHILMDGWCLGIIYEELIFVYGLLKAGRPIELEPAAPYVNYINWLEQQDKKKGLEYWENYLEGYEQGAGIPGMKPGDRHYRLEVYDVVIAGKETRALNTIARKNRVTVNTVFQTLWGILLQKYTNSNDVVFGAVVSGRPPEIKGIEKMVGLFLNTIPIRIKNRGEDNFLQLLNKVQEETAQSKNYEYVSLAEVQAKTSLKGSPIDHIMAFENLPMEEELDNASVSIGGGLDDQFAIQDVTQHSQTNYDFNVIIIPRDSLVVRFNYNSRIVEKEFIGKLGLHLKEIVRQVLDNPGILVKEIGIITEEEKQQVLFDFNQTAVDYPADKTIHELFAEQAERTPGHTAVNGRGQGGGGRVCHLSYGELNKRSGQLAHVLREKGVGPDVIVGITADRSLELIIGILGILKAGGAYLPIDPGYPWERVQYMLRDSNAGVLLTNKGGNGKSEIRISKHETNPNDRNSNDQNEVKTSIVLDFEHLNLEFRASNLRSLDLAYILYTSGSTGRPKGVMVEHRNVVRLVKNTDYIQFREGDRLLQTGAVEFDASTFEIWGSLLNGLSLYIVAENEILAAEQLGEIIQKYDIGIMWLTSPLFNQLSGIDIEIFKGLRNLPVGGDVLSPVHIDKVRSRFPQLDIINGYGPTENTTFSTSFLIRGEYQGRIPIGKPIANSTACIVDEAGGLVPAGVPGELWVGGDGVSRGYLNNPELTAVSYKSSRTSRTYISKRIYKTGDLCRWLPDGNIDFIGRIDRQVKVRGFRIELGEIENQLLKIKGISGAVVIDRKDPTNRKYLCAYIVSKSEIDPQVIKGSLGRTLPAYMVPAYVMPVDNIPLTPNGKVDRGALPAPGSGLRASDNYMAPGSETEEKMVEIWAEILGIDKKVIGVNDNFFERGGDSLKTTILAARIHKVFNVRVPLDEIFRAPTPAEVCSLISVKDWAREQHRKLDVPPDAEEEEIIL